METIENNIKVKYLVVFDIIHDLDDYKILSFNNLIKGEIEDNIFMGSSKPKRLTLHTDDQSDLIGNLPLEGVIYDDLLFELENNSFTTGDKFYKLMDDQMFANMLFLIRDRAEELFFSVNTEVYSFYDFIKNNPQEVANDLEFENDEIDLEIDLPPISKLEEKINKKVIGQSSAIKNILSALYASYKYGIKTNLLVSGPTGVGKSEIFKIIADETSIPFMFEDATDYTAPGYHGKDVATLINEMLINTGYNIDAAEETMIVFDEIDKKMGGGSDSVNTKQALNNMLCLLGSNRMSISDDEYSSFNTKRLFIVCLGAFTDIRNSKQKSKAGFINSSVDGDNVKKEKYDGNLVNFDNLVKAGMSEEFAGRFDKIIELNELTKKDLLEILIKSEISPLKMYTDLLNENGIELIITSDHLAEIVNLAYKMKTGARALKMVVSKLFEDFIYLIESEENLNAIVIDSIEINQDNYKLNYTCQKKNIKMLKTTNPKRKVKKR